LKIAAHDIRRKAGDQNRPDVSESVNWIRDDDKASKGAVNDFGCCAGTFRNPVLREIASAPDWILPQVIYCASFLMRAN
jgi:hypothetical protein